jgi:osmotically-inducible protein OsmY
LEVNMKLHWTATGALIATTLAFASGCGNTSQQQTTARSSPTPSATSGPTSEIGRTAGEAADKVAAKAKEAGDKIAEGARDAGAKIKEGAKEAGAELGVQKQVLDVKAALMADKTIDASKIDVDGDAATKSVTLKGTVPSAAQKSAAEKLAREKAEGYTVRNRLTVAAK